MSETVIERGVEMDPGDPGCTHAYGPGAQFRNLYVCRRCGRTSWDDPLVSAASAVPPAPRRPLDALDI